MGLKWQSVHVSALDPQKTIDWIKNQGVNKAVWKIIYKYREKRIIYIGSTDNLVRHVRESIYRPTQTNLDEYFRCSLLSEAGSADLFVGCAGRDKAERKQFQAAALQEERGANVILLNQKAGSRADWPEWLRDIRSRSGQDKLALQAHSGGGLPVQHGDQGKDDAINDLGADVPTHYAATIQQYARDQRIRDKVRRRAAGKCEYCGKLGFLRDDGSRYVECHHIIALADEGADRLTNVIALCPEHHREAHIGKRRAKLEMDMKKRLHEIINQTG